MKRIEWALIVLLIGAAGCAEPDNAETEGETDTAGQAVAPNGPRAAPATGFVMFPGDGEVLVPCREGALPGSQWVIKADPVNTGSHRVAMGTQTLPGGERIPVHRHEGQDEILFLHEGTATGLVGDSSVQIVAGTTVYVPQGVWHGVDNTTGEAAEIVWVVVPPGLENFFRDLGVPPGEECGALTPEDVAEIHARHGVTRPIDVEEQPAR